MPTTVVHILATLHSCHACHLNNCSPFHSNGLSAEKCLGLFHALCASSPHAILQHLVVNYVFIRYHSNIIPLSKDLQSSVSHFAAHTKLLSEIRTKMFDTAVRLVKAPCFSQALSKTQYMATDHHFQSINS